MDASAPTAMFFSIPREFNEWNAMIQVYENTRNLEMKWDTLLKLGIQLLYTRSYLNNYNNKWKSNFLAEKCQRPPVLLRVSRYTAIITQMQYDGYYFAYIQIALLEPGTFALNIKVFLPRTARFSPWDFQRANL